MRTVTSGLLTGLGLLACWALVPFVALAWLVVWLVGPPRATAPLAPKRPPRTPPPEPETNVCSDCGFEQSPAWTCCWCCSGLNLYSTAAPAASPHLWV